MDAEDRPAAAGTASLAHLLNPPEAAVWIQGEFERLQRAMAGPSVGVTMADGGAPVQDLSAVVPRQDWDRMLGEVFLEP